MAEAEPRDAVAPARRPVQGRDGGVRRGGGRRGREARRAAGGSAARLCARPPLLRRPQERRGRRAAPLFASFLDAYKRAIPPPKAEKKAAPRRFTVQPGASRKESAAASAKLASAKFGEGSADGRRGTKFGMKIEGADEGDDALQSLIADIHAGKRLRKVEAPAARASEGLQVGRVLDAADAAAAETSASPRTRKVSLERCCRRRARRARRCRRGSASAAACARRAARVSAAASRSSAAARPRRSPPETRGSAPPPRRPPPPRAPRPSTPSRR